MAEATCSTISISGARWVHTIVVGADLIVWTVMVVGASSPNADVVKG